MFSRPLIINYCYDYYFVLVSRDLNDDDVGEESEPKEAAEEKSLIRRVLSGQLIPIYICFSIDFAQSNA